jgi:Fe-S cluster assembly protein SufD
VPGAFGGGAAGGTGADFHRLVFVDGRFSPEASHLGSLPDGVTVASLREVLQADPDRVKEHLGRQANFRQHAFTALNTAFLEDGALIELSESARVAKPIHLVFLSSERKEPIVTHPRNLIVARPGSTATIIEHYVGGAGDGTGSPGSLASPGGRYFTNAVTEIIAEQDASIAHYRLQQESEAAYHIGSVHAHQGRDSRYASHSLTLGARLARIEIRSVLDDIGADCTLYGLYLTHGRQHVDHHTVIDHAKPHGTSKELFKGILAGASRGIFSGRIIVREDAQKTSAHQTNRNLLLSDEALADTRPQLEIRHNDVKCTHGAAIGRLDQEMIFYLRSRGIALDDARSLLTHAFANEVLESIQVDEIRKGMDEFLSGWLAVDRNGGEAR